MELVSTLSKCVYIQYTVHGDLFAGKKHDHCTQSSWPGFRAPDDCITCVLWLLWNCQCKAANPMIPEVILSTSKKLQNISKHICPLRFLAYLSFITRMAPPAFYGQFILGGGHLLPKTCSWAIILATTEVQKSNLLLDLRAQVFDCTRRRCG